MIVICTASFVLGMLLGGRFKVLSILPVSLSLTVFTSISSYFGHWSFSYCMSTIFLTLMLLSLGYILRASFTKPVDQRVASAALNQSH